MGDRVQGPYILYVNKMTGCGDNDTGWRDVYGDMRFSHFNPSKPSELQIVTGPFKLPFDINDTYRVQWHGPESGL